MISCKGLVTGGFLVGGTLHKKKFFSVLNKAKSCPRLTGTALCVFCEWWWTRHTFPALSYTLSHRTYTLNHQKSTFTLKRSHKTWKKWIFKVVLLFLCSLSCVRTEMYCGLTSRVSPMISTLFNTKIKCLNGLARFLERSHSPMLTVANSVAASGFNESAPLKLSGDPLYPLRVCNEDRRYASANGTLCFLFSLITNTLWLSVYCWSKGEHR